MLKVKFKRLADDVKLPVKGSPHAACYDVYARYIIGSGNDNKITVGLGFATEIPKGWKGVMVPRSNLTKHNWTLNNSIGIIDSDYRGEWKLIFTPLGPNLGFPYNIGDRVAQIYFDKVEDVTFIETKELENSDRQEGGFGSTGVK